MSQRRAPRMRPGPWLALVWVACAASGAGPTHAPVAAAGEGAPRYRAADAHFHYVDFLQQTDGIEAALAAMDRAGVERSMISGMPLVKKWNAAEPRRPLYYLEDDSRAYWYSATDVLVARDVASLAPEQRARFHPFISGFNATDKNAVEHVQRMLDWYPDFWEGIGEVLTRHDDLTALTYGETARADHPALDAVYQLAAERDLPVFLHANIGSVWLHEPIYSHEVENAVGRHPRTRFLWCHGGASRRIEIPSLRDELHRMLGLYANLSVGISWVVFENYLAPGGVPAPEWIALLEKWPDRFVIGSDVVARFDGLPPAIRKYDVLLDALRPETAERVVRENFVRLLPARVRARISRGGSGSD